MKAITAFLSPTCLEEGRPRVHNLRGEANIKLWINQGYLMNFEGFSFFFISVVDRAWKITQWLF